MSDVDFDDPASFRGQLQRGRGIAVRRAPGEREAADAVYECVIDDPRWDRQTEDRDDYLAGLIVTLDLSLGPVERRPTAAGTGRSSEPSGRHLATSSSGESPRTGGDSRR